MVFSIYDIYKHKLNIISLSNKLLSATNTNEEISINNELKKEAESLLSLLNIKNVMMNQMPMNNMNNFNPMTDQNYAVNNNQLQQLMQMQLILIEHMMQQHQMQQMKEQFEKIQKKEEIFGEISVIFRKGRAGEYGKSIVVKCHFNEKMAKVIERYRNSSSDFNEKEKFIFNAKALNPSITVAEAGFCNNCNIFVVETAGIRGG